MEQKARCCLFSPHPPCISTLPDTSEHKNIYRKKKKKKKTLVFGSFFFLRSSPDLEEEKEINCIKIQDGQGASVFLDVGPKGCSWRDCLGLLASSSPSRDKLVPLCRWRLVRVALLFSSLSRVRLFCN